MRRLLLTLWIALVFVALAAPVALAADGHDGGEGTIGETNDRIVTNFGFVVIFFFPALIFLLSLIQWRLDKRKEERKRAAKARHLRADLRGGW
jgi:hypothetical protein